MKVNVHDFLNYGKANATPAKTLAMMLGFKTTRELQKQIERERASGAVILSDSQGGGYYLSDDPEELRRFTRTLKARARNTLKAAQSAQRALDAATGKERMAGWFDNEDSRHTEKAAPGAGTSESGNANNDGDILSQKASTSNEENWN